MNTFPPAKGVRSNPPLPVQATETGAFSTGKGGIPASLKVKAAGIKASPVAEKSNSLF